MAEDKKQTNRPHLAKKTVTVLAVVLLILSGLVFQLALAAGQTVLKNSFYRELLAVTKLPAFIEEALEEEISQQVHGFLPENLAPVATKAALRVFDEEWASAQFVLVSEDFVSYASGKTDIFAPQLDLRAKKEELKEAVSTALSVVPAGVLELFGLEVFAARDLAESLLSFLPLPDSLDFNTYVLKDKSDSFIKALDTFRFYRPRLTWLPVALFVLLFLLLRLLGGFSGAFKNFGLSALLSGVIFSLALELARSFYLEKLSLKLAPGFLSDPQILASVFGHAIARASALSLYYALAGVLCLFIGGLASWVSAFKSGKNKEA